MIDENSTAAVLPATNADVQALLREIERLRKLAGEDGSEVVQAQFGAGVSLGLRFSLVGG